jgi:error-prone DNA polymerase
MDVNRSAGDCRLISTPTGEQVRMGLRYIKGLPETDAHHLLSERKHGPFASTSELRHRTGLSDASVRTLAKAGILESLEANRRDSIWSTWQDDLPQNGLALELHEETAELSEMDVFDRLCADYRHCGHSTRGHPLAKVRQQLIAIGLPDSSTVRNSTDGCKIRYVGVVICQQKPATAKGVVFLTLEDEFGFVNALIHPKTYEAFRVVLNSPLLGITGTVQNRDGSSMIITKSLWRPILGKSVPTAPSRNWR